MPPKRTLYAKLQVLSTFLATLPEFAGPVSRTRVRKVTEKAAPQSSTASKASSPTPSEATANAANNAAISNFKINSGLKELSTSGLTMNSISNGLYALDKSGKPCRRWVKKPAQFKTFTGFKTRYVTWKHKPERKVKAEVKTEN